MWVCTSYPGHTTASPNRPAPGGGKGSNILQQEEGPDDGKEGSTVYNNPDHEVCAAGLQGNKTSHEHQIRVVCWWHSPASCASSPFCRVTCSHASTALSKSHPPGSRLPRAAAERDPQVPGAQGCGAG